MKFMSDEIFLGNSTASKLYSYVKTLPIYDYHCHLSAEEIYFDKKFYNLTQLWLEGDHYKWRIMRAYGIEEEYITGKTDEYEKFYRFCCAMPSFIGNPVYHWAHLELKKYFGIELPLNESNAKIIWDKTEAMMKNGGYSARQLIWKSNVYTVVTTDDPCDDLTYHKSIRLDRAPFKVLPCFRIDNVINVENDGFAQYVLKLGKVGLTEIADVRTLMKVLSSRFEYFIKCGCPSVDVSFGDFPLAEYDEEKANVALIKALRSMPLTEEEISSYKFCILVNVCKMIKQKDRALLLHVGVMRNCNVKLFRSVGADAGGDSVGNPINIVGANRLFDTVEKACGMPKTMVFTLNPTAYYPIATLLGDYAGSGIKGKMQLGPAWWHCDHKEGIVDYLKTITTLGGLGLSNGMLTDSRSFTSYARHDYFRRILCTFIGEIIEKGEYPFEIESYEKLIADVCYFNAKNYFISEVEEL